MYVMDAMEAACARVVLMDRASCIVEEALAALELTQGQYRALAGRDLRGVLAGARWARGGRARAGRASARGSARVRIAVSLVAAT